MKLTKKRISLDGKEDGKKNADTSSIITIDYSAFNKYMGYDID